MASFCYIQVNHAAVALRSVGTGEPVLMLHSSASSGQQWRRITAALGEDRRFAMPDFPGCGDSARWHGRSARSLEADAAIVAAVADHVGGPVHLVGHSYGGAVALAATRLHPACVRSLAVIEPVAFTLLDEDEDRDAVVAVRKLAGAVWRAQMTGAHAEAMGRFVDYWNGAGTWDRIGPERRAELAYHVAAIGQEFTATLGGTLDVDDLAAMEVPAVVVSGVLSPAPARRIAERAAAALPRAVHHVIAGAGHMAPLSHPEEVAAVLAAHLDGAAESYPDLTPHLHAA